MTTLKLEVGKSYRTRDGRRVTITNVAEEYTEYDFYGSVENPDIVKGCHMAGSDDGLVYFTHVGKYWDDDSEDPRDLISEWQDGTTTVTYTHADIQPLLKALEKLIDVAEGKARMGAVSEARQALERFKGMNTLAPSKTD